jgi:hypothetical protein
MDSKLDMSKAAEVMQLLKMEGPVGRANRWRRCVDQTDARKRMP